MGAENVSKHTKGQWAVIRHRIDSEYERTVVALDGDTKLNVATAIGMSADDNTEMLANAALMSAAPDLLHALKELLGAVKSEPAMNNHKYDGVGIVVNAAIAKAEGRS